MCIRDRDKILERIESWNEEIATYAAEEYFPAKISIAYGIYPVSYTHLDVYKRQADGEAFEGDSC